MNSPAERRRNGVVLACLTVAIALNAGALALADRATASTRPPLTSATADAPPALLLIAPRAPPAAPPRPAVLGVDKATASPTAFAKRTRVAGGTAIPPRLARPSLAGSEQATLRFFRLGELDDPAQPATEWSLDLAALDELGLDRVAFELLIDDRGEIITCSLATPLELGAEVRQALERRLQETQMRPAVRDGVRVASYRRIELYADAHGAVDPSATGAAPWVLSSALADR